MFLRWYLMFLSSLASSLRLKRRSANHGSSITSAALGRCSTSRFSIFRTRFFAGCDTFFQRLLRNLTAPPFAMLSMTLKSSAPA
jgi:hypothetical protein